MSEIAGPFTEEKERYLREEQEYYDKIYDKLEELNGAYAEGNLDELQYRYRLIGLNEKLQPQTAFNRVLEQEEYIKEQKEAWFVYDSGYRLLTTKEGKESMLLNALICVVVLISCLSATFSCEIQTGMEKLLYTTVRGRKQIHRTKYIIAGVIAILAAGITYVAEYIRILSVYGQESIEAPAQSLKALAWIPASVSIAQYLSSLLFLHAILGVITAIGITVVSKKCKDMMSCILATSMILVLPLVVWLLRIT